MITAEHIAADLDHKPVGDDPYSDGWPHNCQKCGLAVNWDGSKHGAE